MALDPNNIVDQIRLLTGDYIEDEPYLNDDVYLWMYQTNGNSILDAAIEALESILNNIALSPASWTIGDASESRQTMTALERRLSDLKQRKSEYKPPVLIGTDRKNWNDIDDIFGKF